MSDRYPGQFEDDSVFNAENLQDADAILELDRVLDALGSTEAPIGVSSVEDPLLSLFSSARAELDAASPGTAPRIGDLLAAESAEDSSGSVVQLGRHRHRQDRRRMGFASRAAATGGLSVTGMVIAGGVAAAIAVGGFGVAAYHGAIPGMPALNKDPVAESSSSTSGSSTVSGNAQVSSSSNPTVEEPRELTSNGPETSSVAAEPSDTPDTKPSGWPSSSATQEPTLPPPSGEPSESEEPATEAPGSSGEPSTDKTEIEDLPSAGSLH